MSVLLPRPIQVNVEGLGLSLLLLLLLLLPPSSTRFLLDRGFTFREVDENG